MTVFIQGMRRSGTTILFDVFTNDPEYTCYYEPLAREDKVAIGGGSGVRQVDVFGNLNEQRARFRKMYPQWQHKSLNIGAPRDPSEEFASELPDYGKAYLKMLVDQDKPVLIKFTRMCSKIQALKDVAPEARLIHIVRDPRYVTASYLYGKRMKYLKDYPDMHDFFFRCSKHSTWSSYSFSRYLLTQSDCAAIKRIPDFMRILVVWKYVFEQTHCAGRRIFGQNYLLVRHEDLVCDTRSVLKKIYAFLGRPLPSQVLEWAECHIQQKRNECYYDSSEWLRAYDMLAMESLVREAGYTWPESGRDVTLPAFTTRLKKRIQRLLLNPIHR